MADRVVVEAWTTDIIWGLYWMTPYRMNTYLMGHPDSQAYSIFPYYTEMPHTGAMIQGCMYPRNPEEWI